jgi:hypothetical protein
LSEESNWWERKEKAHSPRSECREAGTKAKAAAQWDDSPAKVFIFSYFLFFFLRTPHLTSFPFVQRILFWTKRDFLISKSPICLIVKYGKKKKKSNCFFSLLPFVAEHFSSFSFAVETLRINVITQPKETEIEYFCSCFFVFFFALPCVE